MASRKLRNIDAPKVAEPTEKKRKADKKICPMLIMSSNPLCRKDKCMWWRGTDCSVNFISDTIDHYTSLMDTRDYWPHAISEPGGAWQAVPSWW